jgi:peptidylprolyl isomerase
VRRRTATLLLTAALATGLVAVGVGPAAAAAALDGVTVAGGVSERPTVTAEWPVRASTSVSEVRTKGSGTKTAKGDRLSVDYLVVNGRTGDVLETSYGTSPVRLDLAKGTTPALVDALTGTTVGSRVLVAVAPKDGLTENAEAVGLKKDDTVLFVIDVRGISTPLERATGTSVAPPPGLPTVTLAKNGAPTITMPSTPAPTGLVAVPLIKGTGPVVQAGQTIDARYTGAIWDTGKVFDSTWKKRTAGRVVAFQIGTGSVIDGWDQGLVGQTVGSQVLLVIPPALGYGAGGQPAAGIGGTDTLVFVVDILGVS